MIRKFFSFFFFGYLSKHWAGQGPLTDRQRRSLIFSFYSLSGMVLWYQWREMKALEEEYSLADAAYTQTQVWNGPQLVEEVDPLTGEVVNYDDCPTVLANLHRATQN